MEGQAKAPVWFGFVWNCQSPVQVGLSLFYPCYKKNKGTQKSTKKEITIRLYHKAYLQVDANQLFFYAKRFE